MLYCLREAYLDQLRALVPQNLSRYRSSVDPWLTDVFEEPASRWRLPAAVPADLEDIELVPRDDLASVRELHGALRHLTDGQAADERLWAYLTHDTFWRYMRMRWPPDTAEAVRERYFAPGDSDRALLRNGLARLWWWGRVTWDPSRNDPYELTAVLVRRQDFAVQLLERSYSRNEVLTRALLDRIAHWERRGHEISRNAYRQLLREVNRIAGVMVLDVLDADALEGLVGPLVDDAAQSN